MHEGWRGGKCTLTGRARMADTSALGFFSLATPAPEKVLLSFGTNDSLLPG